MFQLGFSHIVLLTVGVINILFNSLCLVLAFKAFDPYLGKDELIPAFSSNRLLGPGWSNFSGGDPYRWCRQFGLLLLLLLLLTLIAAFTLMMKIFVLGAGEAFIIVMLLFVINWAASGILSRFVAGLFSVSI